MFGILSNSFKSNRAHRCLRPSPIFGCVGEERHLTMYLAMGFFLFPSLPKHEGSNI